MRTVRRLLSFGRAGPLAGWSLICCCLVWTAPSVEAGDESPRMPVLSEAGPGAVSFDPGTSSIPVRAGDLEIPYRTMALSIMPGGEMDLRIPEGESLRPFRAEADAGSLERVAAGRWKWKAPSRPGRVRIWIMAEDPADTVSLNLFVLVPLGEVRDGYLNGYRIGSYPKKALRGLEIYRPPSGLIEVRPEDLELQVSPHFRLGQFLCKQEGGFPKYLVLNTRLLLKLEMILQELNDKGYGCSTLHIMSGYRTPHYNQAIGNVAYSRHIYGGAADIFVDENPRDELMDDLNGDGRHDYRDADVLKEIIEDLTGRPFYANLLGGLARYRKTEAHGPFVHIDVRGTRARW